MIGKNILLVNILLWGTLLIVETTNSMPREWEDNNGVPVVVSSGYLEVEGGKLFYEVAGEGKDLVFIHDGLVHRETYDDQFALFGRKYRVIRYDRRGYGHSSEVKQAYSNIEDLRSLLVELKVEKACLIGCSAGGRLAIDFTLAHPERVSSLVLIGAVVSGLDFSAHFYNRGGHISQADMKNNESVMNYWLNKDPYEIAPENKAVKTATLSLIRAHPQNLDMAKHILEKKPARPAVGCLSEINVPVLIVLGEYDMPDVHAHGGAIQAGVPYAQRVIINNAGHLVHMEQPKIFNKRLIEFLREADFFALMFSKGLAAAINHFQQTKRRDGEAILFSEESMNRLGYKFLLTGKTEKAIELFQLNVQAYPDSFNVYDSLGEAYLMHGENNSAIRNYKKSLDINPNNTNAQRMLQKLQ
ncbi:alpha/beta fold hydrolase [candidate division CSSED10-310 bacterium]|uniref:Alpha/beta fold hydrolase n=1 Tax=candidate division CSSED10-310 bacterium TaxID=2855610 RepID=A0ABV6YWJ3_UNCC1